MKTRPVSPALSLMVMALGVFLGPTWLMAGAREQGTPASPATRETRIGIFDSRAVAYAHFWSEGRQRELNRRAAAAKAAKAAGDEILFKQLSRELADEQRTVHLQVFSTAPVDDVLAAMADHVNAVKREMGFTRLVSKWDRESLAHFAGAEQIDVTAKLVALYVLPEKQARTLAELLKREPLPLPAARELADQGRL